MSRRPLGPTGRAAVLFPTGLFPTGLFPAGLSAHRRPGAGRTPG